MMLSLADATRHAFILMNLYTGAEKRKSRIHSWFEHIVEIIPQFQCQVFTKIEIEDFPLYFIYQKPIGFNVTLSPVFKLSF